MYILSIFNKVLCPEIGGDKVNIRQTKLKLGKNITPLEKAI
jgi:hypothetical protein